MPESILTLDIGTSSVRTLLFDGDGNQVEGFGSQIPYHVTTTPDGGWEIDADHLVDLAVRSVSEIYNQLQAAKVRPAAAAFDTFWHNVVGVGENGKPVTPLIHVFDTRSSD
ncbi:MAG: FGGY family carbohydrate kinase, partial [Acidobacteriota bacterium]|nr:FGGY family carbohydrate kinase [Acidobacteriota bacterium]